jgi:hypothetical protein
MQLELRKGFESYTSLCLNKGKAKARLRRKKIHIEREEKKKLLDELKKIDR